MLAAWHVSTHIQHRCPPPRHLASEELTVSGVTIMHHHQPILLYTSSSRRTLGGLSSLARALLTTQGGSSSPVVIITVHTHYVTLHHIVAVSRRAIASTSDVGSSLSNYTAIRAAACLCTSLYDVYMIVHVSISYSLQRH